MKIMLDICAREGKKFQRVNTTTGEVLGVVLVVSETTINLDTCFVCIDVNDSSNTFLFHEDGRQHNASHIHLESIEESLLDWLKGDRDGEMLIFHNGCYLLCYDGDVHNPYASFTREEFIKCCTENDFKFKPIN